MSVKTGDTVRLSVEFKDFNDSYADPTNITLKIYDKTKNQIGNNISITDSHKTGIGKYQYDYTIPTNANDYLVYEVSGILNDKTILGRSAVTVEWV